MDKFTTAYLKIINNTNNGSVRKRKLIREQEDQRYNLKLIWQDSLPYSDEVNDNGWDDNVDISGRKPEDCEFNAFFSEFGGKCIKGPGTLTRGGEYEYEYEFSGITKDDLFKLMTSTPDEENDDIITIAANASLNYDNEQFIENAKKSPDAMVSALKQLADDESDTYVIAEFEENIIKESGNALDRLPRRSPAWMKKTKNKGVEIIKKDSTEIFFKFEVYAPYNDPASFFDSYDEYCDYIDKLMNNFFERYIVSMSVWEGSDPGGNPRVFEANVGSPRELRELLTYTDEYWCNEPLTNTLDIGDISGISDEELVDWLKEQWDAESNWEVSYNPIYNEDMFDDFEELKEELKVGGETMF